MEFVETESEERDTGYSVARKSKRISDNEAKNPVKKKTKEVEEVFGKEIEGKYSSPVINIVQGLEVVNLWLPVCFCGELAKKNEVTADRNYVFFSCSLRRMDEDSEEWKFGCKFWLKQEELDPQRICGCKFPLKKWRNKLETHDYESCVYCFEPADSKIKSCRLFRKKLISE